MRCLLLYTHLPPPCRRAVLDVPGIDALIRRDREIYRRGGGARPLRLHFVARSGLS